MDGFGIMQIQIQKDDEPTKNIDRICCRRYGKGNRTKQISVNMEDLKGE